jgi:hypothetical protein
MTNEEATLSEQLRTALGLVGAAQVRASFAAGFNGGVYAVVSHQGKEESLVFPWRVVAELLAKSLSAEQHNDWKSSAETGGQGGPYPAGSGFCPSPAPARLRTTDPRSPKQVDGGGLVRTGAARLRNCL